MIYDFMNAMFGCKRKVSLQILHNVLSQNNWRCIFNLSLENNNLIISTYIMHKTIAYDYRNAIYSS